MNYFGNLQQHLSDEMVEHGTDGTIPAEHRGIRSSRPSAESNELAYFTKLARGLGTHFNDEKPRYWHVDGDRRPLAFFDDDKPRVEVDDGFGWLAMSFDLDDNLKHDPRLAAVIKLQAADGVFGFAVEDDTLRPVDSRLLDGSERWSADRLWFAEVLYEALRKRITRYAKGAYRA